MKKMRLFAGGVILALVLGAVWYKEQSINPERILAQSFLKERKFGAEVVEVASEDGKVSAYLMEEHSVPLVAAAFGFAKAGTAYEPKVGVGIMLENVLLDKAGRYSRYDLRTIMKEKGINLDVSVNRDRIVFGLSYVKEFEKDALDILKAVLYSSEFGDEIMNVTRQQLAMVRKQQKEKPEHYLGELVRKEFYKDHPYGKEEIAEDVVLAEVTAEDINSYMSEYLGKNNLTVGIAGDMDKKEAEVFISEVFGGLKDEAKKSELVEFVPDFGAKESTDEVLFAAQSFVLMVGQGIKRLDEDFYPLYIANYVLGGSGLMSKFNQAVREEKGLTYGIYSGFSNYDGVDLWSVSFSATPKSADEAITTASAVYEEFYEKGVSEKELLQAKDGLLNSFNLRFSSLLNIATMLEQMQAQKLGIDFLQKRQDMVRKVSLKQVNEAIKKRMPKKLSPEGGVRFFKVLGKK